MTTQKKVERGDGKGNETLKQRRSKGGGVYRRRRKSWHDRE